GYQSKKNAPVAADRAVLREKDAAATVIRDYRGIACPMNFVKVKIDMAGMAKGETLEVYLDDGPPIDNVPRSVEGEGHEIVRRERKDDYWKVVVRKQV
ncbi:MAG: sulfurtransferase TusA family protein, partial [Candidatus Latescibacterota bacterium]